MKVTLADLKIGQKATVLHYEGESQYEFKFISLGILPGDEVQIQSKSLFGGPVSIQHGEGNFLALRIDYAKKIIVQQIN
jgi:Fe2+ transport system protein FeoA